MKCKSCVNRQKHQRLLWKALTIVKRHKKALQEEIALLEKENELLLEQIIGEIE